MRSDRHLLLLAVLIAGCVDLRDDPVKTDPARSTDGGVGRADGGGANPTDGPTTPDVGSDAASGCPDGQHHCPGLGCVENTSIDHCGSSCQTPCPAPSGGKAACDGTRCTGECEVGFKLCLGTCVPMADPCAGSCSEGKNPCGGLCVNATDVNSCGAQCQACVAPPGATATCDGNACGFVCSTGKACGDKCGDCCTTEDCPAKAGFMATCDATTLKCQYACPAGQKACGTDRCIAAGACCTDADCPAMNGQVGKCDVSSGQCQWMCAGDTKPCGGKCIASSSCCGPSGQEGCAAGSVCLAGACKELADRGGTCSAGSDCKSGTCVTGRCCNGGEKFCDGQCRASDYCCNGTSCTIANGSGACNGGSCQVTGCNQGFQQSGSQCVCNGNICNGQCRACCNNTHCSGSQTCNNATGTCDNLTCGECQRAEGHACQPTTGNTCQGGTGTCQGGTCVVPECEGNERSCANSRTLRVCMGGKFVTQDCRSSQGTDGVCVKYPGPSCENVDCATPLRVNSACCDNHGCFSGLCFNNVCKVRNGEACNSTSECIEGQVCREGSPGSFVCALP